MTRETIFLSLSLSFIIGPTNSLSLFFFLGNSKLEEKTYKFSSSLSPSPPPQPIKVSHLFLGWGVGGGERVFDLVDDIRLSSDRREPLLLPRNKIFFSRLWKKYIIFLCVHLSIWQILFPLQARAKKLQREKQNEKRAKLFWEIIRLTTPVWLLPNETAITLNSSCCWTC